MQLLRVLVALAAVSVVSWSCAGAVDCQGAPLNQALGSCTASLRGKDVCTSVGGGYSCTANGCWQPFADGVCTPPMTQNDGGVSCFQSEPCSSPTQTECREGVRFTCKSGCLIPVDTCS